MEISSSPISILLGAPSTPPNTPESPMLLRQSSIGDSLRAVAGKIFIRNRSRHDSVAQQQMASARQRVASRLQAAKADARVMLFTGTLRVRVVEAKSLRPTEWSRRFTQTETNTALIDAYINVDWDEFHVGKTNVRAKTSDPKWNEEFSVSDVHSGRAVGFTVFHNCVMPPDDFVANCRISFDELKIGSANDIWVDLEPHGQLHVIIELHGTAVEG